MVLPAEEEKRSYRCPSTDDCEHPTAQRTEATPSGTIAGDWSDIPPVQSKDGQRERTEVEFDTPEACIKRSQLAINSQGCD